MPTTPTRPKDQTAAVTVAEADKFIVDGAEGTRAIEHGVLKSLFAAAFRAAVSTFKLATLADDLKLAASQIPDSLVSGQEYKGAWDANANTPTLSDGTGGQGHVYTVTVAGTRSLGSGSIAFVVGDKVAHNGTKWERIPQGVTQIEAGGHAGTTKAEARKNLSVASISANLSRTYAGGVHMDGVTANTRVYSTLTGYSVGTNDVTLRATFRVPSASGSRAGVMALSSSNSSADVASALACYVQTTGALEVIRYGATLGDYRLASLAGFVGEFGGQLVDVVVTRSGNVLKLCVNGVEQTAVESSAGTAPAWGDSITSTYCLVGMRGPTHIFNGSIIAAQVFNYALPSSGDNSPLAIMEHGIPFADKWAAPAALYTSDFSAGADGWTADIGSVAGNTDAIGGVDDTLFLDSGAGTALRGSKDVTDIPAGKRVRLTYSVYRPSSNATGVVIRMQNQSNASIGFTHQTPSPDTWTQYIEAIALAGGSVTLLKPALYTAGASSNVTAGDKMYFKDVKWERLGCVVDLGLSTGIGLYIPDRSNNRFWGQAVGGVGHTIPAISGERVVTKRLSHAEISSTAATTLAFELPPNCGILDIEIDRVVAADGGITLDVGITGTQAKFASAIPLDATVKVLADSLSKISESSSANTSIWLKKSGATTVGDFIVRIRYAIRGN